MCSCSVLRFLLTIWQDMLLTSSRSFTNSLPEHTAPDRISHTSTRLPLATPVVCTGTQRRAAFVQQMHSGMDGGLWEMEGRGVVQLGAAWVQGSTQGWRAGPACSVPGWGSVEVTQGHTSHGHHCVLCTAFPSSGSAVCCFLIPAYLLRLHGYMVFGSSCSSQQISPLFQVHLCVLFGYLPISFKMFPNLPSATLCSFL